MQRGREGTGWGGRIHTSVHLSVLYPRREGGRFAKQGKIPERRGRAREGPYMGMGTVSCFPADVCAAAPAPPEPPMGARHPPATVGHGSHLKGCRHRSCPRRLSSACSLPAQGCGTHQHPTTSPASPRTPQCHPPFPYHTHDTPRHPTPITLSTTLHTPPAHLSTSLCLPSPPLPPYPVHLGVVTGGFPPAGPEGNRPGANCVQGAARGAEPRVGAGPKGVNMGTKGKTLRIAWWDRLQGQEATIGGTPGPWQHLQGRRRKHCAAASTFGVSPSSCSKVSWGCRG